jgi:hypothetical protein
MQHDHTLRLALAFTFFGFGMLNVGVAFIPAYWPNQTVFVLSACVALGASMLLDRIKVTQTLYSKAPSGRVKPWKTVFGFVGAAAIAPAIWGLALFFQQAPIGSGANTYRASVLAVFALHPFMCAYALLAASGRSNKNRRARRSGP